MRSIRTSCILLFLILCAGLLRAQVSVIAPNGGERWYVGEMNAIFWSAPGASYVRIEYSTDGGGSWRDAEPGGIIIPAALGAYAWSVPNTPSADALVRVSDADNPDISDRSDAPFAIVRPSLRIITPNGGEKYEMAQPVMVLWSWQEVTTLRLEYSSNGGGSWEVIAGEIPASAGSYTFTPFALPTKRALVRLVDVERPEVRDQSDRPFEIMEAPSIMIYSPVSGDNLTQGSQASITWDATRINAVDLLFSADGGLTWTVLASNIQAPQWYYLWTVPNIRTDRGVIRVRQVGGPVIGESGWFTIGAEPRRLVRVVQPNGGEKYSEGDSLFVRWAFQGVSSVSVSYSSDGGASWNPIRSNVPAGLLQVLWKITSPPGNRYLVKVDAGGGVADTSDGFFEVLRRRKPRITVQIPNGGEKFFVGDRVTTRWSAIDITGAMNAEYSADSGRTWKSIGSVDASGDGTYTLEWTIPDEPTTTALVRVIAADAADSSDAVFEIVVRAIDPIQVVTPNGGEVWVMDQKHVISWNAPAAVTAVDIDFSTDGGANWQRIDSNVASGSGNMQYVWSVPSLALETQAARVRVKNTALPAQRDISDRSFSIRRGPKVAGLDDATISDRLHLLGAYPNPASNVTKLRWKQGEAGDVAIAIYRIDGEQVASYAVGAHAASEGSYRIDLRDLAPGLYLYELKSGGRSVRGSLAVVR